MEDELGPLDVPLLEHLKLVVVVGMDDAEHRDQSVDERLDERFLLHDQQRAALRHDERLVDLLDGGRDGINNDPPLIQRQLVTGIGRHVLNDGARILLEEVEQHAQTDPTVGLLGAFSHSCALSSLPASVDRPTSTTPAWTTCRHTTSRRRP